MLSNNCHHFSWDRVNFLHRGLYDAMFGVSDANSSDSRAKVQLLQSRAHPKPKPSLPLSCPTSKGLGAAQGLGGHTRAAGPGWSKGVLHCRMPCSAMEPGERRGWGDARGNGVCLPKELFTVRPAGGQQPTNSLVCLVLLSLVSCLHLKP